MADDGKPILGICNGFQILIEAGLLPGALLRNALLKFVCKWADLQVETTETAFTCSFKQNAKVRMPIAHNEGRFFADNDSLVSLRKAKQIVLRYSDENPTGTIDNIVAVSNADANVVGMMPHPERASSPSLGGSDGLKVFQSMVEWAQ
jgi:phosphoribosylformylglycinamidine synthase